MLYQFKEIIFYDNLFLYYKFTEVGERSKIGISG